MNKALAIGVLAGAAAIAGGLAYWQQGDVGTRTPARLAGLEAYVPADTVLYMGGTPDARASQLMAGYPLGSIDSEQISQVFAEVAQRRGGLSAAARMFEALLIDFSTHVSTYGDLAQHYGLDLSGAQAIYMHGLYPVARLPLADAAALEAVWKRAGEAAGITPSEEMRGEVRVQRWRLSPSTEADYLDLVMAQDKGLATLTLFSSLDTPEQQEERIGLRKPAQSLADSAELGSLQTTYAFDPGFVGFVHLQRLAQGLLESDSSRLAADLQQLLAKSGKPNPFSAKLDQACRQEMAGLVGAVPRMVMGYTEIGGQGDAIDLRAQSVLEISNQPLSETLRGLRGHLPGHSADQQLLGLAFATDMDKLVPTLMALWQQASEATFTCPQLQQAQQQLKALNPAPLGVATGMMQGIKGIGLSLYGLEISDPALLEAGDGLVRPDLLLSLATENPQLVISLLNTTLVPRSGGQLDPLPLDGSPTTLDLSTLMPGLSATFARYGQHLTFAMGDQARAAAAKLQDESLEPNGILAMAIDYPALGKLVEDLPLATLAQLDSQGDTDLCMAQAQMRRMIAGMPVTEKLRVDLQPKGLVSDIHIGLQPGRAGAQVGDLVGRYELFDIGSTCGYAELIGTEEINSDGSGHYSETDTTAGCDLLEYNYRWTRQGQRMLFDVQEGRYRDSCESSWETLDAHTASCELLPHPDGFECIYTDDESEGLYRYRRLP